jgi:hypothetical protein
MVCAYYLNLASKIELCQTAIENDKRKDGESIRNDRKVARRFTCGKEGILIASFSIIWLDFRYQLAPGD